MKESYFQQSCKLKACDFTKSNTSPWLFFTFFNFTNGTKSRNASYLISENFCYSPGHILQKIYRRVFLILVKIELTIKSCFRPCTATSVDHWVPKINIEQQAVAFSEVLSKKFLKKYFGTSFQKQLLIPVNKEQLTNFSLQLLRRIIYFAK